MSPGKIAIGVLILAGLVFGLVEGCDRWNARQHEKADREKKVADSTTAVAKPADRSVDSLIRVIDAERVETRLMVEQVLARAGRDRATRTIEYRTIIDTVALRIIHRKDTTIDSLSVALEKERDVHDKTKIALDTMTVSRGRWISIGEARAREAAALRKVTPSWWKERIKPRATIGYAVVRSQDGTIDHGPAVQLGFQFFP
jgi:hypothetical protein